ncbi:serine hydrolase [Cellulomonas sp. WB94]|uniref:serine hydrolase domain-containing protein n=1 Tax=Cellulomonas sp. WB94 TaxID=2173174 RepID=UPI001F5B563B|nr:serine hydrolase [Cellulomonas sp. WB94]
MSSRALLALVDDLERSTPEVHSLMVVRHGVVLAEGWWAPYAADRGHQLFSLSKSFTSAAVGLALAGGLFTIDDLVLDHFPDEAPAQPGEHLSRMRVRDLLTMTAGHDTDPSDAVFAAPDWVRAFLAQPVEHAPGTHFTYNTAATYMLSALVQKATGERLLDYLQPRLLGPLGITGATWECSPQGIDTGGFGLTITTEDIACFGQLLLDDGVWRGERLLPAGWVAEATARQVSNGAEPANDWAQGYGYQFWRCRHDAYRADGAFGQFCVVLPDQQVVVAITAAVADMGAVLRALWTHLLPAVADRPEAPDPVALDALTTRLAGLRLDPPAGEPTSVAASGLSGREIVFEPNALGIASAVLVPGTDHDTVTVVGADDGPQTIEAGHGVWRAGRVRAQARALSERSVLASAVWTAADTYVLTVRESDGPLVLTATATVTDDGITVAPSFHVSFGLTTLPTLTGRPAAP